MNCNTLLVVFALGWVCSVGAEAGVVEFTVADYKGDLDVELVNRATLEVYRKRQIAGARGAFVVREFLPGEYIATFWPVANGLVFDSDCVVRLGCKIEAGVNKFSVVIPSGHLRIDVRESGRPAPTIEPNGATILRIHRLKDGNLTPGLRWFCVMTRHGSKLEGNVERISAGRYKAFFLGPDDELMETTLIPAGEFELKGDSPYNVVLDWNK